MNERAVIRRAWLGGASDPSNPLPPASQPAEMHDLLLENSSGTNPCTSCCTQCTPACCNATIKLL